MPKITISPRTALWLFVSVTVVLATQAVWWIAFMARLTDEKVELAGELGAGEEFLQVLQEQEISRQIMLGLEGIFFLLLVGVGAWIIYRALVNAEKLKFHQQNFLMAVTHELKTPLASMKIYLDSLGSERISTERKAQIIPRMRDDIGRLDKLVQNILDAGRFERDGYRLDRSQFDLVRLIKETIEHFQKEPHKITLEIRRSLPEQLQFEGDPIAFRRALGTVIENCIKYNDNNPVQIDITATKDVDDIKITISDNGIGLDPSDQRQIFERFYRAGEELTRNRPGSGLGLYLCREIIRAHGGTIFARSDGVGHGTTFTITIRSDIEHETDISG
jgi:signal transduction histidine kinase